MTMVESTTNRKHSPEYIQEQGITGRAQKQLKMSKEGTLYANCQKRPSQCKQSK
ncbi:hypothetical protein HanXRQr2_Chr12g0545661 [Helianthus annuus]|uniref:Uncharacterized protein n=1 Tax=Helianthus annuus TaxID=4232 RepID=A0A9K3MWH8_HELAN|nr:hypothetical protein HanXRQr2_Chr12g0545661 [Helianthus annuus]KAJ0863038.1 hypothetical protein HanPSC8_Chr12g0525291 [Helianthus annuus]